MKNDKIAGNVFGKMLCWVTYKGAVIIDCLFSKFHFTTTNEKLEKINFSEKICFWCRHLVPVIGKEKSFWGAISAVPSMSFHVGKNRKFCMKDDGGKSLLK